LFIVNMSDMSAEVLYHFNPRTQLPGVCSAAKLENCPFGAEHYTSIEKLELAIAKQIEEEKATELKQLEKINVFTDQMETYTESELTYFCEKLYEEASEMLASALQEDGRDDAKDWKIVFDSNNDYLAAADEYKKEIYLDVQRFLNMSPWKRRDSILHEIAHVLHGTYDKDGIYILDVNDHDKQFYNLHKELGGTGLSWSSIEIGDNLERLKCGAKNHKFFKLERLHIYPGRFCGACDHEINPPLDSRLLKIETLELKEIKIKVLSKEISKHGSKWKTPPIIKKKLLKSYGEGIYLRGVRNAERRVKVLKYNKNTSNYLVQVFDGEKPFKDLNGRFNIEAIVSSYEVSPVDWEG